MSEVFTLELDDEEGVSALGIGNPWWIAGQLYSLAKTKLSELAASNLPPREDVLKAASDAYDKYVKMVEDIAKDAFLSSVGTLYDGFSGLVNQ